MLKLDYGFVYTNHINRSYIDQWLPIIVAESSKQNGID